MPSDNGRPSTAARRLLWFVALWAFGAGGALIVVLGMKALIAG